MRDDQARAGVTRIDSRYDSILRRLNRIEDECEFLKQQQRNQGRVFQSDHYLLHQVVNGPSLAKVFGIETELC